MNHAFFYGNNGSDDYSMRIEKYPVIAGATRRRTTVSIPGRNGDLHYTEEAFSNVQQSYVCWFRGETPTPELAHDIKAWLMASGKYMRLEDTYDPNHFRLATYAGPINIENILNRYGRCTVTFDCDPRAFLKTGETAIIFASSGALYNPTAFDAKPLITVYGSGSGVVNIGGIEVTIHKITDGMVLDCDSMDAYVVSEGSTVNKNGAINAPQFPVLCSGNNPIVIDGGVSKIAIIPRWWEL